MNEKSSSRQTKEKLLARVAELSGGRSVRANVALITNNAGVAGELALALADMRGGRLSA